MPKPQSKQVKAPKKVKKAPKSKGDSDDEPKQTKNLQNDSDNDFDDDSEGSVMNPHNDPEMHDDIFIPKKKAKNNKEKEVTTKKAKAQNDGQPQRRRKNPIQGAEDEGNEKAGGEEVKATGEKKQNKKGKADRFKQKEQEKIEKGVIYVGHLTHGLEEEALKGYFSQYGEITNLNVARSKKTARSRGFAFIEFKHKEVAKIAAESMNNYMLYGKQLECRLLEDSDAVKVNSKKFKFIPYQKIFVERKNKAKSPSELKREVNNLLKHEQEKRNKLAELGINYEFPGFSALINSGNGTAQGHTTI